MPIVSATYAPSKTLYALDLANFRIEDSLLTYGGRAPDVEVYHGIMPAVWTVSKKGRSQMSMGFLSESFNKRPSLDEFLESFDARYGGHAEARWDGEYMWAPQTTLARMNELASILDPFLDDLPNVPAGHDGWYSLV